MTTRTLRLIPLLLVLSACGGDRRGELRPPAEPEPIDFASEAEAIEYLIASSDYRPTAAALLARPAAEPAAERLGTVRAPLTVQEGEIVVMQGNANTVTAFDGGGYGVVINNLGVRNPMEISKEFLAAYPDEYDAIVVFTTFPDAAADSSVAWHLSVRNDVKGIGASVMDSGPLWGSQDDGQLRSFINMQYVGKYGVDLSLPDGYIHAVAAHEFGHRWLSFARYVDASGQPSDALLGRDASHWASTLNTGGSVMDGNEWVETGADGGDFWLKAKDYRFSELDQYLMGLRGADEVPDFFRIADAMYKGKPVDPAKGLPSGITVSGSREDIEMKQVVLAHGERIPDHVVAQRDFRLAIVLLTRPEEDPALQSSLAERLEGFRNTFEQVVNQMSDGRLRVCTQVSTPCDAAGVALASISVSEHEGAGDGFVDPGDTVAIDFSVSSTGFGDAPDVTVELLEPNLDTLNVITAEVSLGTIAEGETKASESPLLIKIPPTVGCGATVVVPLRLHTDGRAFPAEITFDIGVRPRVEDSLDSPDDWTLNPYGTDNAEAGVWEIAPPKGVDAAYSGLNLITQPSKDHSPVGANALVTGPESGDVGAHDVDGGVTTALSAVYDISEATDPLLTWWTWHFAYDLNGLEGPEAVENDVLYTEASTDGGETWVIIDAESESVQKWTRKEIRLADFVPVGDTLQLRFTMSDDDRQSLAEAAVDDIRVWEPAPICLPGGGETTGTTGGETGGTTGGETGGTSGGETGGTTGAEEPDPTPTPPADDGGGCSTGSGSAGSGAPLLLGLFVLLLLAVRARRGLLIALTILAVGCSSDGEDPAATPVADIAADVADIADVGEPDVPTEPDSGPVNEDTPPPPPGPSLECLVGQCPHEACREVAECSAIADCVAGCDSISCAEACAATSPPPFKGVIGDLVVCGAEATCFVAGSGLETCGDGTCQEPETQLNCFEDCSVFGKPDEVYPCLLQNCSPGFCSSWPPCKAALECLSGCTDYSCTAVCAAGAPGQVRSLLWAVAACGVEAQCLPPGTGPVCGNGNCELNEGQLDCPEDCGEPDPGWVCLLESCEVGNCPNSNNCNKGLQCIAQCKDATCTAQCIDAASHWATDLLVSVAACGVENGCMPPEAALVDAECGNGTCDLGEDVFNCLGDCSPKADKCGNGHCDLGETPEACASDCDPAATSCVGDCGQAPDNVTCHCMDGCEELGSCCSDYESFCLGPVFTCLLQQCDAAGCASANSCSEALGCIAECTDADCAAPCKEGQPEQNLPYLDEIITCAAAKACWPAP